jgi:hypothetical protein
MSARLGIDFQILRTESGLAIRVGEEQTLLGKTPVSSLQPPASSLQSPASSLQSPVSSLQPPDSAAKIGAEQASIAGQGPLARILFGPEPPSLLLRAVSTDTLSALDRTLPIPLFIWGLDSV